MPVERSLQPTGTIRDARAPGQAPRKPCRLVETSRAEPGVRQRDRHYCVVAATAAAVVLSHVISKRFCEEKSQTVARVTITAELESLQGVGQRSGLSASALGGQWAPVEAEVDEPQPALQHGGGGAASFGDSATPAAGRAQRRRGSRGATRAGTADKLPEFRSPPRERSHDRVAEKKAEKAPLPTGER